MRKFSFLLCLLTAFVLFSCQKEIPEPEPEEPAQPVTPVSATIFAGQYDQTHYYVDNPSSPPFNLVWDAQNLFGVATGVIFLDQDANADLIFEIAVVNPDSARDSFIFTGPMPGIRVRNLTNWEISYYQTSYAAGMGSHVTRSWTEMLNLGNPVNDAPFWGPSINMWRDRGPSQLVDYDGPWLNPGGLRYLGVRKGQNYGWIEIDLSDPYKPVIKRFAFQR